MAIAKILTKAARKAVKKTKKKKPSKATQKGVRFKKKPETQEGMALDPITGRGTKAASDVDKGKAGKVTRSAEPGFLQQQRTAGSRAAAKEKAELSKKVRDGKATKAEKARLKRLREKDVVDEGRARAKASATRRGKKKEQDDFAVAINRKTGEINEAAFNRLTKNQQEALMRDIRARFSTTRAREIMARIDELEPTKAGETGVRRRKGGPKGMRGATERNIKDIDEGVSRGRGGLDFSKGGMSKKGVPVITVGIGMMPAPKGKKPRTGSKDFRNGGMVTETKNNLNPGLRALKKVRPDVVANILKKK